MKTLLICLIFFVDLFVSIPFLKAEKIPLYGNWNEKGLKSAIEKTPLQVEKEAETLIIQSTTLQSDLSIRIIGTTGEVYESFYPASETGMIVIDLTGLEKGYYTLELTNQRGGYLSGTFE